MALSAQDQMAIQEAVRSYLRAAAATMSEPAAMPAMGVRWSSLGSMVFPVTGFTSRSAVMAEEFMLQVVSAIRVIQEIGMNRLGVVFTATDILEAMTFHRNQLTP
jgi:hypothetical protein